MNKFIRRFCVIILNFQFHPLSYINNRNTMTAKLDVLVVVVLDGGYGVEVLADKVAQYAVTSAVQDTHAAHANQRGVVNKVHHSLYSLVTAHAADIDIGLEGKLAVVDVVVCLLAYVCGGADILGLDGLGGL